MITLSPYNQAEVAKRGTKNRIIAYLDISTGLYLSSTGTVDYDGNTYFETFLDFTRIVPNDYGSQSASIRLGNFDGSLGTLLLGEDITDQAAQIYLLYGDGPWSAADGILIFDGIMEGVNTIDSVVTINLGRIGSGMLGVPNIYYEHQNILPSGTKINVQNSTITLNNSRNA